MHLNVTQHPTAGWTARQIREALPGDGIEPRYLIRDRDSVYGGEFARPVTAMAIEQAITGRKCPRQNVCGERVIGTIRRECTDQLIPLGERHLLRSLLEFQDYYNGAPTHLGLAVNSRIARAVETTHRLLSTPFLGELHRRYRRAG